MAKREFQRRSTHHAVEVSPAYGGEANGGFWEAILFVINFCMDMYNNLNVLSTKLLSALLIAATAVLTLAGTLTLSDAALIDGDHFQDATGVDSVLTNQVMRKGWGFVPGNGKYAIEDTLINYGITFDEIPFLIVKFANSRLVSEGPPADLSECYTTRKVLAAGVSQTKSGFKPILITPTDLGLPATTNFCYTWIAIGRHDASYNGEEDPLYNASAASGIVSSDIADWNTAYSWGDHSAAGYLTAEADPEVGANTTNYLSKWDGSALVTGTIFDNGNVGIGTAIPGTQLDVNGIITAAGGTSTEWNTSYSWGDHSAAGYLTSETDPEVGTNAANYLSKWDGSALVTGTIFDNGNVGIGTDIPGTKLDVNGIITATGGTSTDWNTAYSWGDHSAAGYLTAEADPEVGTNTTNYLSKWDGSALVSGTIFDNGNIGIGTSAPMEKLTLSAGNFLQTPGNPVHSGAISDNATTELSNVRGIFVSGNYAYTSAFFDDGVEILDISDPTNPTHVGAISDSGSTELDGAWNIYVSGKYAYVTGFDDDGVEILDISDPLNPTHVGAISDNATTLLNGAAGIYVTGKYAYIAASYDDGVEILDISDPSNPTHVGAISDNATTALNAAHGIYVAGNYAYVASLDDNGVEILDISDPTNPTHVGAITDDGTTELNGARDIFVLGKYAYVVGFYDNGVEILDISDPANPTHVGAISDNSTTRLSGPEGIYVSGKYAYVASYYDNGVEVLDISDPANPTHAGAIADGGSAELNGSADIYVAGKYAYVAGYGDNGVEVLDISGIDVPSASIGSTSTTSLDVSDNAQVGSNLYVKGSLNVGLRGIKSDGDLSVSGSIEVNTLASASATDLCINGNVLSSCSSSIRYKDNVKNLTLGIETVNQLRPVTFEWKKSGDKDLGFIAEEVADIDPLLVTYKDNRVEGVKYDQLSAVFVNALKELQNQVDLLKLENQSLRSEKNEEFEELKAVICELKPVSEICN